MAKTIKTYIMHINIVNQIHLSLVYYTFTEYNKYLIVDLLKYS